MKRWSSVAVLASVIFLSGTVHAATIVYSPANVSVTLPAGSEQAIPVTIRIENIESMRTYYTSFVDTLSGNLEKTWITASPAARFMSETSPSANVILNIAVPFGTPGGLYSGSILSKAIASHRSADAGAGIVLNVTVPPQCSGVPQNAELAVSPHELWPPNHGMVNVTVTGRIVLPAGCSLLNAGYSIEDEYGVYTSLGHFTINSDRTFTFAIPVEASREGTDKDGRHYRITVFSEDEAGIGSGETLSVIVPHDQRVKEY